MSVGSYLTWFVARSNLQTLHIVLYHVVALIEYDQYQLRDTMLLRWDIFDQDPPRTYSTCDKFRQLFELWWTKLEYFGQPRPKYDFVAHWFETELGQDLEFLSWHPLRLHDALVDSLDRGRLKPKYKFGSITPQSGPQHRDSLSFRGTCVFDYFDRFLTYHAINDDFLNAWKNKWSKIGCVFPMVIWSAFRMGQNRVNDYPYNAPQFSCSSFHFVGQTNVAFQNWPNSLKSGAIVCPSIIDELTFLENHYLSPETIKNERSSHYSYLPGKRSTG